MKIGSLWMYNTRPLIILESAQARYTNITPAHLSSWNPPKPDILYTALGMLPTYRTLSSWKPPNQRNTTQNIYKRAPFLPLSSAQVPCPSSSANYCPILPRVMHRRSPLKSAQATTQLTHARANHKQRKTWFIPKLKTFKYSKVRIILWSTIRTS